MLHRQFLFGRVAPNPVPVPPPFTYTENLELRSNNATVFDYYGRSVAINDTADRLFVGSDEQSSNINGTAGTGRVYVYTKTGTWNTTPFTILQASDGVINDSFGSSISVSSNGNVLVVGAPLAKINSSERSGAAYVFEWSASIANWVQTAKLVASDYGANDTFGYNVTISADGSTIAVGAIKDNVIPTYSVGSVYIFRKTTAWTQTTKLIASDRKPDDNYGCSISLNSDGSYLAIGCSGADVATVANAGAVYCYSRTLEAWGGETKLSANLPIANAGFGYSVAMNRTTSALIVGAPLTDKGSAYVFTRKTSGWAQRLQQVAVNGAVGDRFGTSVAIGTTEAWFAVGAPGKDGPPDVCGAAYVYYNDGLGWVQTAYLIANSADTGDYNGWSLAMTPDTTTVVTGAPLKSDTNIRIQGAATIFTRP